jgi:hypothetical protein
MCLEPIVGITAVAGTDVAVTQQNRTSQCRRGSALSPPIFHESPVLGSGDDLGGGVTEDARESIGADSGPGLQNHCRLATGLGGIPGVDEHGDLRRWRIIGGTEPDQGGGLAP